MLFILICSLLIAIVEAYDCWLTIRTNLQPQDELNPMARWILVRTGATGLVAAKVAGTLITLAALPALYSISPFIGQAAAVGVTLPMLYLAWFLWSNS